MRRDRGRAIVVERLDFVAIGWSASRDFCRNGVKQRQFDRILPDMIGRNGAGAADIAGFGEMHHHIGLPQCSHCLESDEFRVAGPYSDTDQPRGIAHRPAFASALTAAAVMALPPMRPRTIRNGTCCALAAKASLDS